MVSNRIKKRRNLVLKVRRIDKSTFLDIALSIEIKALKAQKILFVKALINL